MIDFGLSCMWTGKQLRDTTGTPFYMAPEVLLKKGYSHPADLWAAGCVLYFLVEGTNPFEPCDTFQNLCHKVSSRPVGFKSQVWTKVSPQIKDLCARLLERDPEKRFTYQQAMDHPWLNVDTYPSAALNDTMVQKFQSHGSFHRLKRKVLTEALKYLELEETGELAMIFSKLDVHHEEGDGSRPAAVRLQGQQPRLQGDHRERRRRRQRPAGPERVRRRAARPQDPAEGQEVA